MEKPAPFKPKPVKVRGKIALWGTDKPVAVNTGITEPLAVTEAPLMVIVAVNGPDFVAKLCTKHLMELIDPVVAPLNRSPRSEEQANPESVVIDAEVIRSRSPNEPEISKEAMFAATVPPLVVIVPDVGTTENSAADGLC
jgi:hypothetical protein